MAAGDLLVALGLVEPGADKLARARALANARSPVPVGLRAVHASWIEAALEDQPERARAVVAGASGPASDARGSAVDVWLARRATAHLPAMIVEPALAARVAAHPAFLLVDGVPTAPAAALLEWIVGIGADQLAFAIGRVPPHHPTALQRIEVAPRKGQLGSRRAAIARCSVPNDELLLVAIGARALAPRLSALAALQLAVRLPRPIGRVVHRELVAHRGDGGHGEPDAPAWPALLA